MLDSGANCGEESRCIEKWLRSQGIQRERISSNQRPDSAVLHHQFFIAVGVKLLRSMCIHFYGFLSLLNSMLICVPHEFHAILCLFTSVLMLLLTSRSKFRPKI